MARPPVPTEEQEQAVVARLLGLTDLLWCAVPNGGVRHWSTARRLQKQGVQRGVPDILIFSRPPAMPHRLGAALEMKRAGNTGRVSPEQKTWLGRLRIIGWETKVCRGADEAIAWLRELGYLQ